MKKTLLLLTLCLACIMTNAQKLDTTLLYGRWDLHNMSGDGHTLSRDSMSVAIRDYILMRKADDPKGKWTDNDSIAAADTARIIMNAIFKTFVSFGQTGEVRSLFAFDKTSYEEMSEDTGTYEWSKGNAINIKFANGHTMRLIISSLTKDRLVAEYNIQGLELTFTRAKINQR